MDHLDRLVTLVGDRLGPGWAQPFLTTPRHLFVPDRAEHAHGTGGTTPIDRTIDEREWLDAIYSDDIILTQRDPTGMGTSSCSMPYMVAGMLRHLDVDDGTRVLEVGTGTGWNAALLCARLGDDHVVTVEVDAGLAEIARRNLAKLDRTPTVVTGDGMDGWSPGAFYDRVLATCAVHDIPYSWITQTRPGGVVLTPWGTALDNGALLRLDIIADGIGVGRFVEPASFMWLRAQQFRAPDEPDDFDETADPSTTGIDVPDATGDAAMFAAGLRVPACKISLDLDDDDRITMVWLLAASSWAAIDPYTGDVRQLGPRRLWDEIETAYAWWTGHDRPGYDRFGITTDPTGQYVWLDDPTQITATTLRRIPR